MRDFSTNSFKETLTKNILSFWVDKMVDDECGGFYGRMDGENLLHPDADKGIILNTRLLWTFSTVYRTYPEAVYKRMADRAYQYLLDYFIDQENGGVYWMIDRNGQVVDTKKQVYSQAFMIYALSEYHLAFGEEKSLDLAKDIYHLIDKYSFDQKENGYLEAFDREWKLLDDLRLSDKDANEAKTMNTHLHVLEAYTNLYRVWKDDGLMSQLENLIRLFLDNFLDSSGHLHLFFDEQWNLKSEEYSYGHDIEAGWLIHEAAEVLGDNKIIMEAERAAILLTDGALEGIDADGGLMNHGDSSGVKDMDKHWWPQAEALVGLVNAYSISRDSKYLEWARKSWAFIQEFLVDPTGEWHWMVNRSGQVNLNEDKAGPWKGPYHNSRAMLELIKKL